MISTSVETSTRETEESKGGRMLANQDGFSIAISNNADDEDEADNHFKKMRTQDKKAYKTKVDNSFGFEAAQPQPPKQYQPTMVSSSTGNDSDEEKAELVRRLQAMEAEEEHDEMFDKPIAFGSREAATVME